MGYRVTVLVEREGPVYFGSRDVTKVEVVRGNRDEALAAAIAALFQLGGVTLKAYMDRMIKVWNGLLPVLRLFGQEQIIHEDIDSTIEVKSS